MSAENNVPAIRFKGFCGDWHEKALGELSDIVRGASPRPIEDPKWFDTQSNVGWLRIRDVSEQNGRIYYLKQRISKLGEEKTRVLTEPHLLLSIAASVGKPVINYVSTGVHDGFLIFLKPIFDREYLFQWLKSFEKEWQKYGQPGSQVNLNSDIVKNQNISIPEPEEQTKIGNYFQQLDTLIAQHQQKHDKLLNIKKSLLEKMFPKQEATVPEIRFNGFSGEWEEKVLGDNADFSKGQGYSKSDLVAEGTLIILYGRLYTQYQTVIYDVDTFAIENNKSIFSNGNEVVVPASGETAEDISRASAVVQSGVLLGGDLNIIYPSNKLDSIFLALTLSNGKPQKDLSRRAQGKSVVHLRNNDLKEVDISYPDITEQTKIGNLFKQLDTLLTQHQAQLKKLNNIKQACLEKMFV